MRQAFAHTAVLVLEDGGDERTPGGAITLALCGSWSHDPPCPLAPHHTRVHRAGGELTLRLLFAAEPGDEERVRSVVDGVLARGWGDSPDGSRTTWELVESYASSVLPEEEAHARRLVRSGGQAPT
ncbi:hypothetical protein [Blastococcus deserti]|uniref:Uncharacterized protein n=1 Tax=Blastococcus deserti TaxID=2259033 RepID=A0ABW4XGE5_9ACTN